MGPELLSGFYLESCPNCITGVGPPPSEVSTVLPSPWEDRLECDVGTHEAGVGPSTFHSVRPLPGSSSSE